MNNKKHRRQLSTVLFLTTLFFVFTLIVPSKAQELEDFNKKSSGINKTGMWVLGAWSVLNLGSGAVGAYSTEGSTRYFHQMNAFWGTVNLAIAGFSLHGFRNRSTALNLTNTVRNQYSKEKIFLLNGALDIAYITGGLYLKSRGEKDFSNRERLEGYGNSIILQGGFLLVFDWLMYFINHRHTVRYLHPILNKFSFAGNSIRFTYRL